MIVEVVLSDLIDVVHTADVFCAREPSLFTKVREWLRTRLRERRTTVTGMSSEWLRQFEVAHAKREPPV